MKEFSFKIPKEGPLSLGSHAIAFQAFDENEFVAISAQGRVKKYVNGNETKTIDLDWSE